MHSWTQYTSRSQIQIHASHLKYFVVPPLQDWLSLPHMNPLNFSTCILNTLSADITSLTRGDTMGGRGAAKALPKGVKKGGNFKIWGIFIAFLSSLKGKIHGSVRDSITILALKRHQLQGGFAPWPPPKGSAPKVASPPLTIYPAAPESNQLCTNRCLLIEYGCGL